MQGPSMAGDRAAFPLVSSEASPAQSAQEPLMSRAKAVRKGSPPPAAPSLRDEAKALYRRAVLAAAEQVFAAEGIHGARIQDIAKAARVSVGTVYNHFESKEDIVAALREEHERELFELAVQDPTVPSGFEPQFRSFMERLIQKVEAHRAYFAFAIQEGFLEPPRARGAGAECGPPDRVRERMLVLLREGMDEGAVERQDAEILFRFVVGAFNSVLLDGLQNRESDLVTQGRVVCELCLRAMRPVDKPQGDAGLPKKPGKRAG